MVACKVAVVFFVRNVVFCDRKAVFGLQHKVDFFVWIIVIEIIDGSFVLVCKSFAHVYKLLLCDFDRFAVGRAIEIPHDHGRQIERAQSFGYQVYTFFLGVLTFVIKMNVCDQKLFSTLFLFEHNQSANAIISQIPRIAHNVGRIAEPKSLRLLQSVKVISEKDRQTFGIVRLVTASCNAAVSFKVLFEISVLTFFVFLHTDYRRRVFLQTIANKRRSVFPRANVFVGRRYTANVESRYRQSFVVKVNVYRALDRRKGGRNVKNIRHDCRDQRKTNCTQNNFLFHTQVLYYFFRIPQNEICKMQKFTLRKICKTNAKSCDIMPI